MANYQIIYSDDALEHLSFIEKKFWLIGNLRDQNLLNTDYTDGHGKSTDFFGVFREIPCNP